MQGLIHMGVCDIMKIIIGGVGDKLPMHPPAVMCFNKSVLYRPVGLAHSQSWARCPLSPPQQLHHILKMVSLE